MSQLLQQCRIALILFVLLSILTGLIYPGVITVIAQSAFPHRANGSVILHGQTAIGSALIGQNFTHNRYFWGRPSATDPYPYNGDASGGSNLSPTNPAETAAIQNQIQRLKTADPHNTALIPVDLVMASGSGLDPDISPDAAYYQVHRVATARHLADAVVYQLVTRSIQPRQFGLLGEPRVNVLQLNAALDSQL